MDNLDKLAKLQELRASGALSEAEFEKQKSSVLGRSGKMPWALAALLFVLVVGLSAKLFLIPTQPIKTSATPASESANSTADINAAMPDLLNETAAVTPQTPPPLTSAIARIFVPDMLGAQLSYLEANTGPPWRIDGAVRTYKVAGCTIDVTMKSGQIFGLGMDVGPSCSFATKPFFANEDTPPANAITFRTAVRLFPVGKWSADCLGSCGNAADPVVSFTTNGYHADNWIVLKLDLSTGSGDAASAFVKLENRIESSDASDVEASLLNCKRDYDPSAASLFSAFRANRVAVYAGDYPDSCQS